MFDSVALELRRGDAAIDLQPKVVHFLGFLLENRDRTVAQTELLDALWPSVNVGLDSLTRVVSPARRALGDANEKRILDELRRFNHPLIVEQLQSGWQKAEISLRA